MKKLCWKGGGVKTIDKLFEREAFIDSKWIYHEVELKNISCLGFLHVFFFCELRLGSVH